MKNLNSKELFAVAGGMKPGEPGAPIQLTGMDKKITVVIKYARTSCCAKLGLMAVGAVLGGVPTGIVAVGVGVYFYGDDAVKAVNAAGNYLSGQASSAQAYVGSFFAKEEAPAV